MGVGEKRNVGASFSDGGSYPIRYASDAPLIATVDVDGTVHAVAGGSANISLESDFGGATIPVTVGKKPTGVKLTALRKQMGAPDGECKDVLQLSVELKPADAASALRFYTSKSSIATVDERGLVTAHKQGSVTITVKTFNNKKATIKLSVKKAPASVELSGCPAALGVGETGAFAVSFNSGSGGGCAFSSDNPDVLEVDPVTGEFTAHATGSATLSAQSYNDKLASLEVAVKAAPTSIALAQTEATLGKGEYMPLPKVLLDAGDADCAGGYRFTSGDDSRAAITEDGRIKARKVSDVIITASTYNERTAQLLLHVVNSPLKMALDPRHKTLGVGEILPLGHHFHPADAASKLTYESSKPSVATVDENGAVTAVAPGTVKISARTYNKKSASVKFTVLPQPESIDLPEALALGLAEVYALQPILLPEGSGGGTYFWVDDEKIASVDPVTGEITATAVGDTILHAELYNGLSDTCKLAVRSAPTGISLPDQNFSISVKDTYQLQPPVLEGGETASGLIRYKSSSGCVKVSQTGLITAVKTGSAKITVSTYNKLSAKIIVRVKGNPKSIDIAEDSHRLLIDHEFTPEVSLSNGAISHYSLSSSDPAVAAICEDGVSVRGVGGGTAVITATAFNGKQDSMEVWVPFLPDSVALDPAEPALGAGDSVTLRAVIPEGQGAELHYECSDDSVAGIEIIDNEIISVAARSAGVANITVRSQNGREGVAKLTVFRAPTALSVIPSSAGRALEEGQLQLRWSFGGEGEGGHVEFASGDESIATVDSNGLVRFLKTGKVKITAKSYNGHTAACALTIGRAPTRMFFEQAEYPIALGDTVQLPVCFEGGCESYALDVEDSSVLSASGDMLTALSPGETAVTAVSCSGLRADCTVRVVDAPTGLELDVTSAELTAMVGQTLQLHAKPLPDGVGSVRYFSSNPAVAIVDSATGLIVPVNGGDCSIRAVTYDGNFSAECSLLVHLPLEGVKVGIDPGHQARGNMAKERKSPKGSGTKFKCAHSSSGVAHVSEHKINLQVGLKLRDALERLGAEVYMTRETANVDISNQQRALMMNDYHVDLVLRIHCNSWSTSKPQGFTIIRRKTCAYKDADVDPKQGSARTLIANEKKLASSIAKYYKQETGAKERGIGASDEYTMNNWSKVPCLLMELGFMTHRTEGKKLVDPDYQALMVKGLVEGICDYSGALMPVEW